MFVDHTKFTIRSGKGGAGCASFRREKFIELGGPDGGDGGNGGNVYFKADNNTHTLAFYSGKRLLKAQNGEQGGGRKMHGKKGEDLVLVVAPGTSIYDDDSGELLLDMLTDGEKKLILSGGKGGLGNVHFKNSVNQAPTYAQPGEPAKELNLRLELKSIADVGLVGFPNVGKSTLISSISNARPQISNYEFTTLTPKLGRVNVGDFNGFIMADIPGIITRAHEGKGLGLEFLRHIERTKILLFMLDLCRPDMSVKEQFDALKNELSSFSSELAKRPFAIALTRSDACENPAQILAEFSKNFKMKAKIKDDFLLARANDDFSALNEQEPYFIACISSATNYNLDELKYHLFSFICQI